MDSVVRSMGVDGDCVAFLRRSRPVFDLCNGSGLPLAMITTLIIRYLCSYTYTDPAQDDDDVAALSERRASFIGGCGLFIAGKCGAGIAQGCGSQEQR